MTKIRKRILSIFLVLCLVFSMTPVTTLAAEDEQSQQTAEVTESTETGKNEGQTTIIYLSDLTETYVISDSGNYYIAGGTTAYGITVTSGSPTISVVGGTFTGEGISVAGDGTTLSLRDVTMNTTAYGITVTSGSPDITVTDCTFTGGGISLAGDVKSFSLTGTTMNTTTGIAVTEGSPTLYLDNVSITAAKGSAINITATNSITTIHVTGENNVSVTGASGYTATNGAGVYVAEGSTVIIEADRPTGNVLKATGGYFSSGIGGYCEGSSEVGCGNITIRNVTVYAYSGSGGYYAVPPGIGTTVNAACATITISGAVVYAYGSYFVSPDYFVIAPAIGHGYGTLYNNITVFTFVDVVIKDSTVYAYRCDFDPEEEYGDGCYVDYSSDYIGFFYGAYYADGASCNMSKYGRDSVELGDNGSATRSTIYCYTGTDATVTDTVKTYACGDDHIGGTATCTELAVCTACGKEYGDYAHTGGTATCISKATCDLCGESYGEVDSTNHSGTVGEDGYYTCCGVFGLGSGTTEDPYRIDTAARLIWFAEQVNNGSSTLCAKLTANIVLNDSLDDTSTSWTPIGYYTSDSDNVAYAGTFDGQGYTISGLYFSDTSTSYVGLFGYVSTDGVVKNVGLTNSSIKAYSVVGGIVGLNKGTVSGCWNTSPITGSSDKVAGIVAANDGTVQNCYNTGNITGSNEFVGGIVGYNNTATITGCYNTGTISGKNDVGGIAGKCRTSSDKITNCYNTGTVTGSGAYVGGIVGYYASSTIATCYNTGKVTGSNNVGGIFGYGESGTISDCYSTGTISGTSTSTGYVGSIGGRDKSNSSTISNCYYISNTTTDGKGTVQLALGEGTVGSAGSSDRNCFTAVTSNQFASGEVTYLLNGSSSDGDWKQTIGKDNYPNFTGKTVYYDETNGYYNEATSDAITGDLGDVVANKSSDNITVTIKGGTFTLDGETANTFTVSADQACIVLVKDADGNYTRLTATANGDGSYSFTTALSENDTIVVTLKGDMDFNGEVNNKDITLIKKGSQEGNLTDSELAYMELTNDGQIDNKDITLVKRAADGIDIGW